MYLINLSDLSIYLAIYPPIYLAIYVSLCVHTDRHIYTHLRAFKSRVHRFCIDMRILIVCEYLAVSFVLFRCLCSFVLLSTFVPGFEIKVSMFMVPRMFDPTDCHFVSGSAQGEEDCSRLGSIGW